SLITLSNKLSTMSSDAFRVRSVTLETSSIRHALVMIDSLPSGPEFPPTRGSFPNILKFDLRLHALSIKRHKSRKVRCQHIQQGYAPAAQANETRLTGNPSELGCEIHGVLEIADLVD